MDSVIFVLKIGKGSIKNRTKRKKSSCLIVNIVVKEQENRLKKCAIVAQKDPNQINARNAEWNVLT
jgi:hypothetical protein